MKLYSLLFAFALGAFSATRAEPLRVCATTPDLGALVREVGGDEVEVTVFAKPGDDPHFLDAKPGFIRALNRAAVYVETGLELEVGWAPLLLQGARNPRVMPGQPGYIDASRVIEPLEIPTAPVDRSQGDVHPGGNPHYLLGPKQGLAVAALLRKRLSVLRPERDAYFQSRYDDFVRRLEADERQWEAKLAPYRGAAVVADHDLWPYFAETFGIRVAAFLEPKPGMPPTTRHLQEVIERMRAEKIRVIVASPFFDERHARFVAEHTGAQIVRLAHQPGSRPGSDGYLGMINYNATALADALAATK